MKRECKLMSVALQHISGTNGERRVSVIASGGVNGTPRAHGTPLAARSLGFKDECQRKCKRIRLTRGLHATIDATDYPLVGGHKWLAVKSGAIWYASNAELGLMHRLILGLTDPAIETDHQNRNGLDNRRSNLRVATRSQNLANRAKFQGPIKGSMESQFKGVSPRGKKWAAYIGGKRTYLGLFATEEVAALAYDAKALELFGEFACLNLHHLADERKAA